jgi:hypothetical protein
LARPGHLINDELSDLEYTIVLFVNL